MTISATGWPTPTRHEAYTWLYAAGDHTGIAAAGVTSGPVMLSFPADEKALARQGERLNHWLNALAERAEREGVSYGVAFGSGGWRSVAAAGQASREAYARRTASRCG